MAKLLLFTLLVTLSLAETSLTGQSIPEDSEECWNALLESVAQPKFWPSLTEPLLAKCSADHFWSMTESAGFELAMHLVKYAGTLDNISLFFQGILTGFEVDATVPSPCVRNLDTLGDYWGALLGDFVSIFTQIDLSYAFKTIEQSQTFMGHVTEIIEVCNIQNLGRTIGNLNKASGIGVIILALAYNWSDVVTNVYALIADIENGKFNSAGIAFGHILSTGLNYQI